MAGVRADPEAYVRGVIEANANMLVPHYLIHSFLYYEQDRTLISDDLFDLICRRLRVELDALTHPHKHLVDPECLRAGTGFYLSGRYPALVIGSANALYNQFHLVKKAANVRPRGKPTRGKLAGQQGAVPVLRP